MIIPGESTADNSKFESQLPDALPSEPAVVLEAQGEVAEKVEQIQEDPLELLVCDLGLEAMQIMNKADFASPEWAKHIALWKGDFLIVSKAEKAGLPPGQVKMYLLAVVMPLFQSSKIEDHAKAFRFLTNTKIASPEVCNVIGRRVMDELWAQPGYTLTDSYLDSQFGKQTLVYAEAVERLRTAPPVFLPPPVYEEENEGGDDDDEKGEEKEGPVVTLSSKVSMREMWDAISELLGEDGFENLGSELHDSFPDEIASFLLVDSADMEESVSDFCARTHPVEGFDNFQLTLKQLMDYLPVHFTD